ncbi:hypothetical protein [Halorubrum cibi]|uniref:DUF8107 domain-containing protein n=1 Tax=Halorubrum cibi TaxID=413815 RepID=A0A521AB78_9EURY|nr:hypothetical protein [Halorubrum cibi]SMO32011.1 hypothetical protein SAMN06264867_10132 [Halorubrum cibi]
MSEEQKGLSDGVEESRGDPRVLLAMNAVLSLWLGWTIVWGLDLLEVLEYGLGTVAGVSLGLFALTYVVVLQ